MKRAIWKGRLSKATAAALSVIMTTTLCLPVTAWAEDGVAPATDAGQVDGAPDSGVGDGSVASIDGTGYATVKEAINAASDGATIKLVADVEEKDIEVPAGKSVTLDLAGHTLTSKNSIEVSGNLTLDDSTATGQPIVSSDYETVTYEAGKIVNANTITKGENAVTIVVKGGGAFTQNAGTIESQKNYTIGIYGNNAAGATDPINTSVYIKGGYQVGPEGGPMVAGKGALLEVSGGVIVGTDNAPVAGNGTIDSAEDDGGTTINISGGTLIGHIKSSGYIALGIYHPQAGTLNITGGTIYADGGAGIVMRAGELNMTGGEVIATGTAEGKAGDGSAMVPCAGIYYDLATNYPGAKDGANRLAVSGDAKVSCDASVAPVQATTPADGVEFTPAVSGGTFSGGFDDSLLSDGFELTKNEDGSCGVTAPSPVAEVNGAPYPTLQAAVDAANGAEIKLLADVTTPTINITSGMEVNIDLNGHNVTFDGLNNTFRVEGGTLNLTGEGTVREDPEQVNNGPIVVFGSTQDVANYSVVTVGADVTLEGWAGIFINNVPDTNHAYGVDVTFEGTINSILDYKGGAGHGIYLQGNITPETGNVPTIKVTETADITSKGNGIYAAGYGKWDIAGEVQGVTGMEIRSGELTVKDPAHFIGGDGEFTYDPNGNGSTTDNAALVIAQHTTKKPIKADIQGGIFEGTVALAEVNPQKNDETAIGKLEIAVTGGEFKGEIVSEDFTAEKGNGFITGGTFTDSSAETALAPGYVLSGSEGAYGVEQLVVATVDGVEYHSLQEAIDAAADGATIVIENDFSIVGEDVAISGKALTIDLNGHMVEAANRAGDNLEITDGAQVTLRDSSDTNKDGSGTGKIIATEAYQNGAYGNTLVEVNSGSTLTLESGLIDAAQFDDPSSDGQFGIGVLTGATVNIEGGKVKAGWYPIAGNGSEGKGGTTVNVEGGILESTADYGIYNPQDGEVNISGGVVYGAAGGVSMNEGTLNVTGGTITSKGVGDTGDWGDGTGGQGNAAISLNGEYGNVEATITGGKITAEGDAVVVSDGSGDNAVSLEVSGGTFSGEIDGKYIADGFQMTKNDNGTYGVEPSDPSALLATSLIAYEGGSLDGETITNGLPVPEWEFEGELSAEGWNAENSDDVPFDWAWVDEDGNVVEEDGNMATAGVYTLRAWANADYPVVKVGDNKVLDFNDDKSVKDANGEDVTVEVRDITDDAAAEGMSAELFRSVYGEESPLATASSRAGGSALDGSFGENGTHTDACDQAVPHAHVAEGTTFLTNGDADMPVENGKIALLWDELLSEVLGNDEQMQKLTDKALGAVGGSFSGKDVNTRFQYIDLVDMANGNTWVQTADGSATTVYMPYADGMGEDDVIEVVYFDKLTRDYTLDLDKADLDKEIAGSNAHKAAVTKTDAGILFDIPSGEFGPIEVLWQAEMEEPVPAPDPDPDPDPDDQGDPKPLPDPDGDGALAPTGDAAPLGALAALGGAAALAAAASALIRRREE